MLTIYKRSIDQQVNWECGVQMEGLLNFPNLDHTDVARVDASDKELALILNAFRVGTSQTLPYPPEVVSERGYMSWYKGMAIMIVETLQAQIEKEKPAIEERLRDIKVQRDIAMVKHRRELNDQKVDMPEIMKDKQQKRIEAVQAAKEARARAEHIKNVKKLR